MSPPRRGKQPHYPLDEVLRCAPLAWVRKSVARKVVDRLGTSDPVAAAFIRKMIASLTPGAFVETVLLSGETPPLEADVYGIKDRHGGWYIKFYMQHGQVIAASCHAPKFDMHCSDGTLIKGECDD